MISKVMVGFLVGLATQNAAACSLAELIKASDAELSALQSTQLPASDQQSTEGGLWEVYSRRDGSAHSVIRKDFGETGQREIRVSFVGAAYSIASRVQNYAEPIQPGRNLVIASESVQRYLYCGQSIYSDTDLVRPIQSGPAMRIAAELRAMIFEAPELKAQLKLPQ